MLKNFELGIFPALDLTNKLLELIDIDLWELVEMIGGHPMYALSWMLTWFSHDLDDFKKV